MNLNILYKRPFGAKLVNAVRKGYFFGKYGAVNLFSRHFEADAYRDLLEGNTALALTYAGVLYCALEATPEKCLSSERFLGLKAVSQIFFLRRFCLLKKMDDLAKHVLFGLVHGEFFFGRKHSIDELILLFSVQVEILQNVARFPFVSRFFQDKKQIEETLLKLAGQIGFRLAGERLSVLEGQEAEDREELLATFERKMQLLEKGFRGKVEKSFDGTSWLE